MLKQANPQFMFLISPKATLNGGMNLPLYLLVYSFSSRTQSRVFEESGLSVIVDPLTLAPVVDLWWVS